MKRRRTAIRLLLILVFGYSVDGLHPNNERGVHNFQMYGNADCDCRNSEYSKGHQLYCVWESNQL